MQWEIRGQCGYLRLHASVPPTALVAAHGCGSGEVRAEVVGGAEVGLDQTAMGMGIRGDGRE